jgi:hypothetical protein
MIGAIVGILLGVVSIVVPMPLIAPIFGMALGANALIKERRGPVRNKNQVWAGIAAIAIGGIVLGLALVRR